MNFVDLFCNGTEVLAFTASGIRRMPSRPDDLHHELALAIPGIDTTTPLLWLLESSLPTAWQRHDWRNHDIGGQPFSRRALIVREARWPAHPLPQVRRLYYRNAFPRDEYDFIRHFQDLIRDGRLHFLPRHREHLPPTEGTEWFLLAHGDHRGMPAIPPTLWYHPAQTVWLLACGSRDHLQEMARQLLSRGARTVVYPCGPLSAPEIENLLRHRLKRTDQRPEKVVAELPDEILARSARLEVMGAVELDESPVRDCNAAAWRLAHGSKPRLQLEGDFETWERLRDAWSLGQLWPESVRRLDLGARLLWLAERHDHPWMETYLRQNPHWTGVAGLREQAKAMRRLGQFKAAARYLHQALETADSNEQKYPVYTAGLLIALDMNLPENAWRWLMIGEPCRPTDPETVLEEEFKELDWRARIQIRRGDWDGARGWMERKLKDTLDQGGSRNREMSVLLGFGAWHHAVSGSPSADELDRWAQALEMSQLPTAAFQGNDTRLYQLRSLAFHRWARGMSAEKWLLQALVEGCHHSDPGPAAQGLLACAMHRTVERRLVDFAFQALEEGHYYLEAAVFAALLNDQRCLSFWNMFCRIRNEVVRIFPEWSEEAVERKKREETALTSSTNQRCQCIVQAGMIPL